MHYQQLANNIFKCTNCGQLVDGATRPLPQPQKKEQQRISSSEMYK